MSEQSKPTDASRHKPADGPPSRKRMPETAMPSMQFGAAPQPFGVPGFGRTGAESGGGINGGASNASTAATKGPPHGNLFPPAPKAAPSIHFPGIADWKFGAAANGGASNTSTPAPMASPSGLSVSFGIGGLDTASTGAASSTSTTDKGASNFSAAAPKPRGYSLFGGNSPLPVGVGWSTSSTGGTIFGKPNPMDSPNHAGGAPRTSDGGHNTTTSGAGVFAGGLSGGNTFSAAMASSSIQDGLFGRSVSKYAVTDKRVAPSQAIDLGSTILTITAGEGERQRTFTIHESLIASRSDCIKNFITEHPETKTINLASADPNAFHLYTQLLYFNSIPSLPLINDNAHNHEEYCVLAKLYVLGVSMQDRSTKNAAIDAMFAKAQGGTDLLPSCEHVWILYNGTSGPCAARRMLVDFYAAKATAETMQGQEFPVEFMNDLAMSFVAGRSVAFRGLVVKGGAGVYHE